MRITFINRYYYPDVSATAQILFDLSQRLVANGYEVRVLCSRQLYQQSKISLLAEEEINGVSVYRVRTTRFGRNNLVGRAVDYISFYFSAGFRLLQITRPNDVLVAKTDPPLVSVIVAIVAVLRRAKLVNWLQDLFPEVAMNIGAGIPNWLARPLIYLRDFSLKKANANVVIGNLMKSRLISQGISPNTIHVIENWADGSFIQSKPHDQSKLRAKLGLQNKFVVSYSGNLGRAHEYQTLLQAAILLRNDPQVVFLVIGGGAKNIELEEEVKKSDLDNFVFLPYQPRNELSDSLAAGDVQIISLLPELEGLIVPSKFYGILAAGRPSIMIGDVYGEVANIVRNEHCGEVVAIGDSGYLVDVIKKFKNDFNYLASLGNQAKALYEREYTAENSLEDWKIVIKNV